MEKKIRPAAKQSTEMFILVEPMGCKRLSYQNFSFLELVHSGKSALGEKKRVNYYPFGLQHKGYNNVVIGTENNYKTYQSKELEKELGLNWHDFGARRYMADIGRWISPDPLSSEFPSWSPYTAMNDNPINFVDPTGMAAMPPSTHIDEEGNVMAVYDDGDLGVYVHSDNTTSSDIDAAHTSSNTSAGGKRVGRTLHTFSFVDGAELERGNIVATGMIDLDSNWARNKVQSVLNNSYGILHYGIKAQSGGKFDIKLDAVKQGLPGGIYYGSQIKKGIYASARDAGNFTAGVKAKNSLISSKTIKYGYGAYNAGNNSIIGTLFSIGNDLIIRASGGNKGFLQAPSYGEDKQSFLGIQAGIENSNWFD